MIILLTPVESSHVRVRTCSCMYVLRWYYTSTEFHKLDHRYLYQSCKKHSTKYIRFTLIKWANRFTTVCLGVSGISVTELVQQASPSLLTLASVLWEQYKMLPGRWFRSAIVGGAVGYQAMVQKACRLLWLHTTRGGKFASTETGWGPELHLQVAGAVTKPSSPWMSSLWIAMRPQ